MDGNLSSKGQSAERLVELCSAGLTAVDWVEREPQGMHQLGVEEKNWEGNSCPLQTATMADINKTEPVFSVCLEKKKYQPVPRDTGKKIKAVMQRHKLSDAVHITLSQNRTDWCKKHVAFLGKKER